MSNVSDYKSRLEALRVKRLKYQREDDERCQFYVEQNDVKPEHCSGVHFSEVVQPNKHRDEPSKAGPPFDACVLGHEADAQCLSSPSPVRIDDVDAALKQNDFCTAEKLNDAR